MRALMDPRRFIVSDRLLEASSRAVILSAKGGVGKTTVTAAIALRASQMGLNVGLIDMDFYNPTLHLALGLRELPEFKEENGIVAPEIYPNLHLLSIAHFTANAPMAFRGSEATDALIELLSIARWEGFQLLLADTPPGMGETLLNILTFFPEDTKLLLISRGDELSITSLKRLLAYVKGLPPKLRKREEHIVLNGVKEHPELEGIEGDIFTLPEVQATGAYEVVKSLSAEVPDELISALTGDVH